MLRPGAEKPRDVIAYHEAGHAVASWALHVGPVSIRLLPPGGLERGITRHVDDGRTDAESLYRRAVLLLAGPEAQMIYAPEWKNDGAERELDAAMALLARSLEARGEGCSGDRLSLAKDRACEDARAILDEHWGAVARVAGALIARPELSGGDLAALLGRPPGPGGNARPPVPTRLS